MNFKKISPLLLVLIVLVAASCAIVAGSVLLSTKNTPSDPLTVTDPTPTPTPTPAPQLTKVILDVYQITTGSNVQLSTTLSPSQTGVLVTFYNQNDAAVGTGTTDGTGKATAVIQPPKGTWTYYAQANV